MGPGVPGEGAAAATGRLQPIGQERVRRPPIPGARPCSRNCGKAALDLRLVIAAVTRVGTQRHQHGHDPSTLFTAAAGADALAFLVGGMAGHLQRLQLRVALRKDLEDQDLRQTAATGRTARRSSPCGGTSDSWPYRTSGSGRRGRSSAPHRTPRRTHGRIELAADVQMANVAGAQQWQGPEKKYGDGPQADRVDVGANANASLCARTAGA